MLLDHKQSFCRACWKHSSTALLQPCLPELVQAGRKYWAEPNKTFVCLFPFLLITSNTKSRWMSCSCAMSYTQGCWSFCGLQALSVCLSANLSSTPTQVLQEQSGHSVMPSSTALRSQQALLPARLLSSGCTPIILSEDKTSEATMPPTPKLFCSVQDYYIKLSPCSIPKPLGTFPGCDICLLIFDRKVVQKQDCFRPPRPALTLFLIIHKNFYSTSTLDYVWKKTQYL